MKQFRPLSLFAIFLFLSVILQAQSVGINTTGDAPAAGSILDVSAIDKAVLLPRTTTESIANPIEGMVIYDTTAHQFHYYNGIQWCALLEEGAYQFYWADEDGDGYGYPFNVIYSPDPPEFFVDNNDDCDDTNADINPAAEEVCDGLDNDCNGLIDFEDPGIVGAATYWFDSDGDGYGNPDMETMECNAPEGYVDNSLDCDDTNPSIHPDANEVCDGQDNDCNGLIDADDPNLTDGVTYYEDLDNDGFGNTEVSIYACEAPSGYVPDNSDCDDLDMDVNPAAAEICDGIDNDCNGLIDGEDTNLIDGETYYQDLDGDGYGNPDVSVYDCEAPTDYVLNNLDCDDTDVNVNPDADEICDGIDNDCNGLIDGDDPGLTGGDTFYQDSDGDEYGNPDETTTNCTAPPGYVTNNFDCNDQDANINPDADEVCDYIDNNCNGEVDEGFNLNTDPNNCGDCGNTCDDGFDCTSDLCNAGLCINIINPGKCLIDGMCYDDGELRPGFPCQVCDESNPTAWTNLALGTPCPGGECDGEGDCIPD